MFYHWFSCQSLSSLTSPNPIVHPILHQITWPPTPLSLLTFLIVLSVSTLPRFMLLSCCAYLAGVKGCYLNRDVLISYFPFYSFSPEMFNLILVLHPLICPS